MTALSTKNIFINMPKLYKGVNLNPTTCLGVQVAEFSNLQHTVCCKSLDPTCWVLILQSIYRGALRAPI